MNYYRKTVNNDVDKIKFLLLKWFLNVKYVLLHNVRYLSTFYG